MIKGKF
jgi:hypothetical protein